MYQGPGIYQHYKHGDLYFVLMVATISDDQDSNEEYVVYIPLYTYVPEGKVETRAHAKLRRLKEWNEQARIPEPSDPAKSYTVVPRFRLVKSDLYREQPFERAGKGPVHTRQCANQNACTAPECRCIVKLEFNDAA